MNDQYVDHVIKIPKNLYTSKSWFWGLVGGAFYSLLPLMELLSKNQFPTSFFWLGVALLSIFGLIGGYVMAEPQILKCMVVGAAFPTFFSSIAKSYSRRDLTQQIQNMEVLDVSPTQLNLPNHFALKIDGNSDNLNTSVIYRDSTVKNILSDKNGTISVPHAQDIQKITISGQSFKSFSFKPRLPESTQDSFSATIQIKENKWWGMLTGLGFEDAKRYEVDTRNVQKYRN